MNKKTVLLSLCTSISLFAMTPELEKVKKEFEELPGFKNFNTKVIDLKAIDGDWYSIKGQQETKLGKRAFDAFSNKKTIVFGTGFNLETGDNLNIKTDFSAFKKNEIYSVGNGKEEFFLVTDPECPFCKQLEEKMYLLKDKATVHVLMVSDLIPSHLAARGMQNYILSLPQEKRASEASNIMLENDKSKILKKIDKYNISMYQNLSSLINNPQAARLTFSYIADLEKAFSVKLDTPEKIDSFLNKKISELSKENFSKIEEEYKNTKEIIDMYFKPSGTPMVYSANGQKLNNQFEMFIKAGAFDFNKVKELATNKELSITAGKIGAKKLYYFVGTQCHACKNVFNDKKKIDEMLAKYEVHFILGQAGGNEAISEKEIKYIYSLKDEKEKFSTMRNLLEGNIALSQEQLNKTYSKEYENKIAEYLFRDLMMTFVLETPSVIDEDGKKIN